MYSLRHRVNALRRRMALELAVLRLGRLAQEHSIQCTVSLSARQPAPGPHAFISRVVQAGFRLPTFMAAHNYLDRCRRQDTLPDCDQLLRSLLPWSAALGPVDRADSSPPDRSRRRL